MKKFPELKQEDLKVSQDVVEENRVGQRSDHISWVWRFNIGQEDCKEDWMTESEC